MKKTLVITTIIIDIFLCTLIPLNTRILTTNIPEYISIILGTIILLLNILIWIKLKKVKNKIIISIISLITVLIGLCGTYCNPYWNSIVKNKNISIYSKEYDYVLTKEKAQEDLEYAMKYLKKIHPKLLKNIPEEIQEQYNIVKNNIENQEIITVNYLAKEIETIFSKLNDAHTMIAGYYNDYHILKEIYTHNKNKETLTKINNIEIKELFEQNKMYYSYEMEEEALNQFKNDIITLEGLTKLGINTEEITYTFESNKKEKEYKYTQEDFITQEEYNEYNNITPKPKTSFVRYEIAEEDNLAILYLDECNNNDEYKRVLNELFNKIKEKNIDNIAVDLRNNGGGDSSVATEFLKYIDVDKYDEWAEEWRLGPFNIKTKKHTIKNKKKNNTFNGNIYVLTSINTFSSAMDFAMYIKDNNLGTIIGEASSNDPNSYGMITKFKLPNSGIYMQISTKKWYRINETTEEQFIEPDIYCNSKDAIFKLYEIIKNTNENSFLENF